MRTNQSKYLLFGIIVLMLFSFQAHAQDSWTLLKEESNVQVFYMTEACGTMEDVNPLALDAVNNIHETFKLKIINNNASTVPTSLTFSKITKTDDSDEIRTITVASGTTILDSCEAAPTLIIARQEGDGFPISISDYINDFILTIQN